MFIFFLEEYSSFFITTINLVKDIPSWLGRTNTFQDSIRNIYAILDMTITRINSVKEDIARQRLFEGAGKCIN